MEKMQISRRNFHQLVRQMNNPEFPTDESLLKFLFGTPSAMAVFIELLKWLPYSKRPDGSIYKSDAQLAYATRRSSKSVGRARPILKEAGFSIYIKKANGTPTNHYRFDVERFLAFVASKVNVAVEQVREWLLHIEKPAQGQKSKSAAPASPNDPASSDAVSQSPAPNVQADVDNSVRSLTASGNTDPKNTESGETATNKPALSPYEVVDPSSLKMEILSLASILRVRGEQAEAWVMRYGMERVKEVAKRSLEDKKIRNPGGWARTALERGYQWAQSGQAAPRKSYADYRRC